MHGDDVGETIYLSAKKVHDHVLHSKERELCKSTCGVCLGTSKVLSTVLHLAYLIGSLGRLRKQIGALGAPCGCKRVFGEEVGVYSCAKVVINAGDLALITVPEKSLSPSESDVMTSRMKTDCSLRIGRGLGGIFHRGHDNLQVTVPRGTRRVRC